MVVTMETFDDLEQCESPRDRDEHVLRHAPVVVRDAEGNEYFCAVDGAGVDAT